MTLKTIRLELARTKEFPDGSAARGYELRAPLTEDGHLDVDAFPAVRAQCTVRRFWAGEDDSAGTLHRTRHRTWAISYQPGEDDDEPIYRLEHHQFRPGDYVTITEQDGASLPFKVVSVR